MTQKAVSTSDRLTLRTSLPELIQPHLSGTQLGLLRYAGTLETHFEPSSLLVDQRGYLYHPSPSSPTLGSGRRKRPSDATEASNRYGPYSLLRSQLVIDRLSEALDVDDTTGEGEYRFEGKWYSIGSLKEGHLKLGQQVREH